MHPANKDSELQELHRLVEMLSYLDVGLVVLDGGTSEVSFWNSFMENHSGIAAHRALGKTIFSLFPDLDENWFSNKIESVLLLKNRAFTTWEQRPYLFRFANHRVVTGIADFMYQNTTLLPLTSLSGKVESVAILIYDVTDIAVNRLALSRANADLQRLSRTDRLTGLNNRGYWEECLVREFTRRARYGDISTLVIFDIDHFKKINDQFGHQAGDEVIRQTAALLGRNLRNSDIGGRYGGEEFVALLVDTDANGTQYFAERLRKTVESQSITYMGSVIKWTISLGIAQFHPALKDHKQWLEKADQALYQSKQQGRNRVTVSNLAAA
ncbi:MAG: sensor domain-containing diguanylate cyclase [Gammaproteobacteria bacterium]